MKGQGLTEVPAAGRGARGRKRGPKATAVTTPPKVARNLTRSFFEIGHKRCNSNDHDSMFEAVAGELRATLLRNHCDTSNRRADGHDKARPGHTPLGHDKAARPHRGRAAVAVALGFEPRVAVTPHSISSAAPSAARTRYLTRILYYTDPRSTQIDRAGWEQGHTTPAARRPGAHEQARTPMGAPAVSETGLARVHTKGIHKIRTPLHATNNPQNTRSTQPDQATGPHNRTRPPPPACRTVEYEIK